MTRTGKYSAAPVPSLTKDSAGPANQSCSPDEREHILRRERADRKRLLAIAADRNTPAKVVWRAKIILATADGLGTMAIMRETGKSKPCVWRWQERFMHEGVDGLLRDKTRPPGTPPLPESVRQKVLAKTASETPPSAKHWSVRSAQERPAKHSWSWAFQHDGRQVSEVRH